MNNRICTSCLFIKPFEEFHWQKNYGIPFSKCKICYNKKCRDYRNSEHGKKIIAKNDARKERKKKKRLACKEWKLRNPNKYKAQTALYNAIRDKRITKKPCEICGNIKVEGHHISYEQKDWFNVRWLCKKHHTEETYKKII